MSTKLERTIERLETALMIRPDDRHQRVQLGRAYQQARRYADAEDAYQTVLRAEPNSAEALYSLGLLRHERELASEALTLYQRAVVADGEHIGARRALAEHAVMERDFGQAREHYEHLVRLQPNEPKFLRACAAVLMQLSQNASAAVLLERAMGLEPDDLECVRELCACWTVLGESQKITSLALPLVDNAQLPLVVLDQLGHATRQLRSLDEAERVFRVRLAREGTTSARCGLAWTLLQKGRYSEVIKELEKSPEESPEVLVLRGQAFFHLGKWADAAAALLTAVELAPGDGDVHHWFGLSLLQLGKLDQAVKHLRHAVRYLPTSVDSWVGLASALVRLEQWNSAVEPMQQAIALEPAAAGHHARLGELQARLGRNDLAEACYSKAAELEPGNGAYWLGLGETRVQLEQFGSAERDLERATQLLPSNAKALAGLGSVRIRLCRLHEAIAPLERALHLEPADLKTRSSLAGVFLGLRRFAEVLQVLERVDASQKESPVVLEQLGQALFELRRFEDASVVLTRRTALPDVASGPWVFLGLALEQLSKFVEAEAALKRGVELDGVSVLGLAGLGRCRLQLGTPSEAIEPLERWARLTPNEVDAWRLLGQAHGATNALRESRNCLDRALALAPNDGLTLEQYGLTLAALGDHQNALEQLRRACSILPGARAAWRKIAEIEEASGQLPAAIEAWRKVLAVSPQDRGALGKLAELCHRAGDATEALAVWRRVLQDNGNDLEALVGASRSLATLNRDPESVQILRQVLRLEPARDEEARALSQCLMRLGQYEEALTWLRQANSKRPTADGWEQIATCLECLKQPADEFEALAACLELNGALGPLWRRLGLLALQLGYRPRGIDALEKAISLGLGDALVQEKLGEALRETARDAESEGALEAAFEMLARAERFQANDPLLFAEQSLIASALQRPEVAVERIRRANILAPANPEYLLRLASLLLEQGELDSALAQFRKATVSSPARFEAWVGLGKTLAGLGQIRPAIDALRQALTLRETATQERALMGTWMAEEGLFREAVPELERVLKEDPLRVTAARWLARGLTKLGQLESSTLAWRSVLRGEANDVEALFGLGKASWDLKSPKDAKFPLEQILEQIESGELSESPRGFWELWGRVSYALGDDASAEPALERAAAEAPNQDAAAELAALRVSSLVRQERFTDALREVDQWLSRAPSDVNLLQLRARALAGAGQTDAAAGALKRILANPDSTSEERQSAAYRLSDLYREQLAAALSAADPRRSEETLTELLGLSAEWGFHGFTPEQAGAWYGNVVALYRERGEVDRAMVTVETALSHFPKDAFLYVLRGQLFEQSKAWERARETYVESVAIKGSVEASLGQGRVLCELGRWTESKAALEQALRIGAEVGALPSTLAEVHEQLLRVGEALDDHPLIVKHADELGRCRTLRVNEWRILGFALAGVGRFADAVEAFQAVLDEHSGDGDARFAMAMALHHGQRSRAAIVPLRQLVKEEPARGEAWRELGRRLAECGEHTAACEPYEQAASLLADNGEISREWVDAAVASGNAAQRERALSHACAVVGDPELKVQWASVLEQLGDATRATEVLAALLESSLPQQLAKSVSHQLAALELSRGQALATKDPEQARWVLLRAGEHAVGDPTTLLAVVQELVELGAAAPAIQLCDKGLELNPADAELAVFLGGVATKRGEHARAAEAYERVVQRKPDQVHLLLAAGRARLAANQPAVAEGWLKRAAHLDPSHGEVAALLEKVTSALGQTEGTLQAQEAMLQVNPEDAGLHERYVRLLASQGFHDRVAAAVRRAESLIGANPALLALGASSLHASGRYAEAVIWAKRALEASPNDTGALRALGASQIELGELEEGVDALLRVRVAEPGIALGDVLPLGLVGRGRVRAERGDFQAAAVDFEQALEEGAEPLVVLPSLASAARRSKQLARALGAARDLAEMQPNASNLCMVGELCLELGQPRDAAIAFEAAVNLEPSGAGYLGLGIAHYELGDERTKAALERAMELRPSPEGYELLARRYLETGEWAAAAEAFESLVKHRALTDVESTQLAQSHEKAGNLGEAARVWSLVAEQHPSHEEARWESGRLQLSLGNAEGAVEALEKLLSINPHHPHANGALGRALARLGRAADALQALERQVRRGPEPELLRLVAQQRQKLGQDAGSIAALERVVQLEPSNAQAWCEVAPLLTKAARHNEAVAAARRAVSLRSDRQTRGVLGDALAHFADYSASRAERAPCRAALAECAELADMSPSTLASILNVSLVVPEPDIAVRVAEKLIQTEPEDARLHQALGRGHVLRGDWALAAAAFEAAANLVLRHQHRPGQALPESSVLDGAAQMLVEWSRVLQKGGQFVPAAQAVDRALRLGAASDDNRRYAASVHQEAAEDLLGQGFADRALPLLERASELTERPAEVAFLIALAHRLSGHTERAIEAARDCLNFEPTHQGAFRLGKELLAETRDKAALHGWYEEHTRVRQEPDVAFEYAKILVQNGSHEPARRSLWSLLENSKWREPAAQLLADSFRATEEWEQEVDVLTTAAKRTRLTQEYRRRLAESLEKLGRLDEAAVAFEHVLRGEVDDAEQLIKLAALQLEVKRHDEALNAIDRALSLQPTHLAALRMKAWTLKLMDRPGERVPVLQKITQQDPQAKELEELADLCLGQKRPDDAERALAQWARLYPKDARAHLRCGLVRAQWGEPALAIESLELALRLDSTLDVARARLGELSQRSIQRNLAAGDYLSALVQSERWAQNAPKDPDALHMRAECLQALGRGLEAVAVWRLVLTEHPGHAPSAQMFAAQLAGTGRFDEAELVLAKAVGANRGSRELMSTLAQLYVTQRKFEQAEIVANRALGLAPDDVDVLVLLSQIAANTSRSKEAEDHARHALRINPNHSEANYTLGKLYLALGRLDLAQSQLDKLVRINSPRAEKLASRLARVK